MRFKLQASFKPTGDQPSAIEHLVRGVRSGAEHQTLLGVTGSGKSVGKESPVFIKQQNVVTQQQIGSVVDGIFARFALRIRNAESSEYINMDTLPEKEQFSTFSFSPKTGKSGWRRVTQISRHNTSKIIKTTAACGRTTATTDDHNFFVARDGVLRLVDGTQLARGDWLPAPTKLDGTKNNIKQLNIADYLEKTFPAYCSLNKIDDSLLPIVGTQKYWRMLNNGERLSIQKYQEYVLSKTASLQAVAIGSNKLSACIPAVVQLDKTVLHFFGYFIAEGHATAKYIVLSTGDGEIADNFQRAARKLNLRLAKRGRTYDYQISSSVLSHAFSNLFGHNALCKQLPPFWPQLSDTQLGQLLSAYFSGDGWVEKNGIAAATSSDKLASDLQYALLRFGIYARRRRKKVQYNGQQRTSWVITITGTEQIALFKHKIGFSLARKQQALRRIANKTPNTNVDIIPIDGKKLQALRQEMQLLQKQMAQYLGVNRSYISMLESGERLPSRTVATKLLAFFKQKKFSRQAAPRQYVRDLSVLLQLRWTCVNSVQIQKNNCLVYDFAVESNETFLTGDGGLFVHNTFTMANIVAEVQKPTLVISHNKTLAAQLASEFQEFFPNNAVHYFVSYYDYYQPEAYIAKSDTYIEKETQINEEIDRLRLASTQALLTRKDVLIVASVSCIYGLGNPANWEKAQMSIKKGARVNRNDILRGLNDLQYSRSDYDLKRGTFRVKGDVLELQPGYAEFAYRVEFFGDEVETLATFDPLTGDKVFDSDAREGEIRIFPAKHFVADKDQTKRAIGDIREELRKQIQLFKKQNKLIEAQRIEERTGFDLEMIEQAGYCSGIENYSRHMDGRSAGEPPSTLLDYFPDDFLLFIDESHMTVPQIGGMYSGDRARKEALVNYGFRLPSAMDNRPLKFEEFTKRTNQTIYVSATPAQYELAKSSVIAREGTPNRSNPNSAQGPVISKNGVRRDVRIAASAGTPPRNDKIKISPLSLLPKNIQGRIEYSEDSRVAEQLIRPTGLVDPVVEIKPTKNQIDDLMEQIQTTTKKHQRVLVTTLTKRLAEELAEYLAEMGIKVHYLHSEVDTLDRLDILRDLRLGVYDVVVGINLLREGLDLPEVSLVVVLDADKEGFLRSETSLIQTMGRAARHSEGRVVMYADTMTGGMLRAIAEVSRRRSIQEAYNRQHGITPTSIQKKIKETYLKGQTKKEGKTKLSIDLKKVSDEELPILIKELEAKMELAARNLDFEKAVEIRDQISLIRKKTKK